jgi:cytochrome P450
MDLSLADARWLIPSSILGDAVGVKYGERWRIIRKHFDPEFAFQTSRRAVHRFEKELVQWCDGLSSAAEAEKGTFVIDIKRPSKFLPFRLVSQQLYGEVFSEEVRTVALLHTGWALTTHRYTRR